MERPFEITRYGPSHRIGGGGLKRAVARFTRGVMRRLLNFTLNFIYATNIPWDPVVVIVLRKKA